MSTHRPGRHFLQIPGPTNVPERVAHALARSTIDHRSEEFSRLTLPLLEKLKRVFATTGPVILYPSAGSGAWEASLANTLSPGDRVLFPGNGYFSLAWQEVAAGLGLVVERMPGSWRSAVDLQALRNRLQEDRGRQIRALALVHSETSTGVLNDVAGARAALDGCGHDALLLVDVVSSIGAIDYRHDEWGVDVTVAGSQKGLMVPPGIGFNAPSARALEASRTARLPRSYWDWEPIIEFNGRGFYPYTPPINLLFGLDEALSMLLDEGLPQVFARHKRLAEAARRAVQGWGLEVFCQDPQSYSHALTAALVPSGCDADRLRSVVLERFNMSLGAGLGEARGKVFRIGHLGDFNELMLAGTLCGVEMGLAACGMPHTPGGVGRALRFLVDSGGGCEEPQA